MAVINKDNYEDIAVLYADAASQLVGIADYYYQAAREVLLVDEFGPELDLLRPFWEAYLGAENAYTEPPNSVVQAVRSLQEHVLNKARDDTGAVYTDINDWFDDEGIADLPSRFKTLSLRAGYEITI